MTDGLLFKYDKVYEKLNEINTNVSESLDKIKEDKETLAARIEGLVVSIDALKSDSLEAVANQENIANNLTNLVSDLSNTNSKIDNMG